MDLFRIHSESRDFFLRQEVRRARERIVWVQWKSYSFFLHIRLDSPCVIFCPALAKGKWIIQYADAKTKIQRGSTIFNKQPDLTLSLFYNNAFILLLHNYFPNIRLCYIKHVTSVFLFCSVQYLFMIYTSPLSSSACTLPGNSFTNLMFI